MNNTLTALNNVSVGHSTHLDLLTGTTVVLFDNDLPVAYSSFGGSPGTFNTDAFRNGRNDNRAHGIFISGGSWTGLQAGGEIIRRMIELEKGYKVFNIINPNITGAIIFDLGTSISQFDPTFGREAVDNATKEPALGGNVGAGTGAAVGKFYYPNNGEKFACMKTGVGFSRINFGNGGIVCAMTVLNAIGNITLPDGSILAGNRSDIPGNNFMDFQEMSNFVDKNQSNTTITIIGTNVNLKNRENYERVATIAAHGHARAINPVNTFLDGDTIFVFSTEEIENFEFEDSQSSFGKGWGNFMTDIIAQKAALATQQSIYDACYQANSITFESALNGIVPSAKDFPQV